MSDREIKVGGAPCGSIAISADKRTLWLWPEEAQQALRALDIALFPWGNPGVVPTEPGWYWVYIQPWGDMNEPWLAVFDGDFWHTMIGGTDPGRWDPTDYNKAAPSFRTCWTPGAP